MMLKSNWRYLMYVLRHKWYVWRACVRLGVQFGDPVLILWRGVIHDWQKFTPAEWRPYVLSFYGPWGYTNRPEWLVDAFDRAWLHHQHHGPHHWQHWLLREDDGDTKALPMPLRYVLEMVADWHGAGRAINGKSNLLEWYSCWNADQRLHLVDVSAVQALANRIAPLRKPEKTAPTTNWREHWDELDQSNYSLLMAADKWTVDDIMTTNVCMRLIETEDEAFRPALWRRHNELTAQP